MGCWAHCRRKFQEVSTKHGKAKVGLDYCNQIFRIERELQGLSPDERREQRQQHCLKVRIKKYPNTFTYRNKSLGNILHNTLPSIHILFSFIAISQSRVAYSITR